MNKQTAISRAKDKAKSLSAEAKKQTVVFAVANELRDGKGNIQFNWRTLVLPLVQLERPASGVVTFARSWGLYLSPKANNDKMTFAQLVEACEDEGNSNRIVMVHNPYATTKGRKNSDTTEAAE